MSLAAELGIDQFRPQTPKRVMGWDDAGMPVLVSVFQGATSLLAGTWGLVPAPAAGDEDKCLFGDGTWRVASGGGGGPAYPDLAADETIDTNSHNFTMTNAAGIGGVMVFQSKNISTGRSNTLQLASSGSILSHVEGAVTSSLFTSLSQAILSYQNATGYRRIVSSGSGLIVQSTVAAFPGMQYAADYRADFTALSLVDKGYVDAAITAAAGIASASNGLSVSGSAAILGGSNITLPTELQITTGSLSVTGADKAFTFKSNSGLAPKVRIEGDGVNTDGRNYEFEPQLISGFIRGLLWKYSTAHNTAATQPAIFVRDNGWIYFGATSEGGSHMIYRPNNSLAVGSNIQSINDVDFIQGANISNLGTQGRNILKGQNYSLKGTSYGNFIYADSPDNDAASMNNLAFNFINSIGSSTSVQNLGGCLVLGDDYQINQAANEYQTLYCILMGNHNECDNSHHLFQFGTGLVNKYTNALHGNWKFQPKFVFGNANVDMGAVRSTFVIANGMLGAFRSQSLTHLADGWTQINTSNTKGFEGGGTDVTQVAADVTPKAAFEVVSTTSGILFPRMTTTQRDAIVTPLDGLVIYNSTTNKLQIRAAAAWADLH